MPFYKRSNIAVAFGIIAMLTATALVLFGDVRDLRYVWVNKTGLVLVAGPSGWLAGLLCGGLFGSRGGWGWLGASLGAVLSTVMGSIIAGSILLPVIGTMVAPLIMAAEIMQGPAIAIVWVLGMGAIHLMILKSRA